MYYYKIFFCFLIYLTLYGRLKVHLYKWPNFFPQWTTHCHYINKPPLWLSMPSSWSTGQQEPNYYCTLLVIHFQDIIKGSMGSMHRCIRLHCLETQNSYLEVSWCLKSNGRSSLCAMAPEATDLVLRWISATEYQLDPLWDWKELDQVMSSWQNVV